ncbi:MAG TPA: hypothetical protein VNV43_00170 [Candidatus Acidoferrales bacterium]|nr:hypothetical protein [Candidatus Acidoferrales bacterium]
MRFLRLLLAPDTESGPGSGGDNPPPPPENNPTPAPAAPPTDPPAARTVIGGTKTERETKLETDLQAATETVKQRETKIAELEDQLSQLKPTNWRPFKL